MNLIMFLLMITTYSHKSLAKSSTETAIYFPSLKENIYVFTASIKTSRLNPHLTSAKISRPTFINSNFYKITTGERSEIIYTLTNLDEATLVSLDGLSHSIYESPKLTLTNFKSARFYPTNEISTFDFVTLNSSKSVTYVRTKKGKFKCYSTHLQLTKDGNLASCNLARKKTMLINGRITVVDKDIQFTKQGKLDSTVVLYGFTQAEGCRGFKGKTNIPGYYSFNENEKFDYLASIKEIPVSYKSFSGTATIFKPFQCKLKGILDIDLNKTLRFNQQRLIKTKNTHSGICELFNYGETSNRVPTRFSEEYVMLPSEEFYDLSENQTVIKKFGEKIQLFDSVTCLAWANPI
jgi:hypothetical protein